MSYTTKPIFLYSFLQMVTKGAAEDAPLFRTFFVRVEYYALFNFIENCLIMLCLSVRLYVSPGM